MAADPYTIRVSPGAQQDVQSLRPFDQKKIVEGIETHLSWEPTKASRSRIKQMAQPFWCQYRLRIDDFRVYYDVDQENRTVTRSSGYCKKVKPKPHRNPTMKQVEITPGLELDTVLQQIKDEDIVLMRQGHAIALLCDFDDDDLYWYGREQDPQFQASLKQAREQAAQGQAVALQDLKKQLEIQ
jgi:mRNA-degrading endonuclease RelE of RelBE toxin-antitoxin system